MLLSITLFVLVLIWALLMMRSGVAEYRYYQAVKTLEPDVWLALGAPKFLKIPWVFVSPRGSKLLQSITNEAVGKLARHHRQAGIQFLAYVIFVLMTAVLYFKIA